MKDICRIIRSVFTVVIFICVLPITAQCQYNTKENWQWVFSTHCGLNFQTGEPTSFHANIDTDEGSASVADSLGNLLFYTDGTTVYNRAGAIMPGGAHIVPAAFTTNSCTQGAQIVQNPGNINQYYVFSLQGTLIFSSPPYNDTISSRLFYSIIDLSLNGGMGDVLPGATSIPIDSFLSEKMLAVKGDNCNFWLIAHKRDSAIFYAYEITAGGVDVPVISNTGGPSGIGKYVQGVIGSSPDGRKIVSRNTFGGTCGTEIFNFNSMTGVVSNATVLSENGGYGAAFSPDNTKLYTNEGAFPPYIVQYDISLPTAADIIASRTNVAEVTRTNFSMRLGPDSKIYFPSRYYDSVNRLNYPNLTGASCGYQSNVLSLGGGRCEWGLPNIAMVVDSGCKRTLSITDENKAVVVSVYPNPASANVYVETEENSGTLFLCDITGRIVEQQNVITQPAHFDTRVLPVGLYYLVWLKQDGAKEVRKIIIN